MRRRRSQYEEAVELGEVLEPYPQQQEVQQQPVGGSFTTRFQAQSAQRMPTSFGSVMAGNATGMYQPVAAPGRCGNVQQ